MRHHIGEDVRNVSMDLYAEVNMDKENPKII